VATFVSLLAREQIERLPERVREVVEYLKSGLSLNHVQGCLHCFQHICALRDQRQQRASMSDLTAL
jgi:hypothetical protein